MIYTPVIADGVQFLQNDSTVPYIANGVQYYWETEDVDYGVYKYYDGSKYKPVRFLGGALESPDGTKWNLYIDNDGNIITSSDSANNFIDSTYSTSFSDSDLSSGVLTITHSLDSIDLLVMVYDNNGAHQTPQVTIVDSSTITCDLTGFGTIPGTWKAVIR